MLFTDVTRWSCQLSVGQDRDYKMAGVTGLWRVLERHKSKIIETDVNRILYALCQKGLISVEEELLLRNERDHEKRVDLFVNILSKKGFAVFREFCATLEVVSPCLLTSFLLDIFDSLNEDKATAQSLKQELILRDRNLLNLATGKFNNRLREKDRSSLSSKLTGDPLLSEEWDHQTNKRWRHSMPLPHTYPKSSLDILDGQRVTWEYHTVTLTRVAGYGFGIAVSGGRDNPHFANGDPAIAISDVLKAGPAEGKLQINDRVVSANGISLENVNYNTAVQVLRDCGPTVNLVIKRRVVLPPSSNEPQSIKVTLTKSKKKDDFGIVLGCRIYVKEITNRSLVEKEGSVQEGDVIMKINTASTDTMTLKEARKLIENSKERLQLIVRREAGRHNNNNNNNNNQHQQWSNGILFEPPHTQNKDLSSPANFVDVTGTRPQWTNQNLYVQPPTRGDYRSPLLSDCNDDKNNLSRMQGGRNRGPLMDISLSQLDQPATPLLTGHGHSRAPINLEDEEPPPRPPLPRIDEYCGRRDTFDEDPLRRNKPTTDPRFISFQKDGNVGIRLTGGNEVGIFVTAVQPGSPALLQGLQPGDKILKVNDVDMRGMTREEAVLLLLTIQDQVNLIVQHFKEEYDEVVANQRGDSFYIRTHFSYEGSVKNELNFRVGEIFHVIDTLHNGVVGSWLVYRLGRNNQEIQKGIIPNRNRAEEWAHEQQIQAKKDTASESRGSFFKRRSARRSKSLSKDHWEDIVFADGLSKFPAYERVTLKHPGFTRPVVLFGPLADVARDKLLKDYPDQYASPQLDSQLDDIPKSQKSSGIIRLSAIKEIIQKGKHAVLDITPNAVDRLNYAQFYPIVIFMHAENKHTVKELRSRLAKSSHKSSKKLYDHAVKLEKLWSHIFTAVITLTGADMWYKKLRDTIDKQQQQAIWVSESKPQEAISDDFLFPMTSRLSYASSPESDLDLTNDTRPMSLQARSTSPPGAERHMVKASSDPSIATQEDMGGLPGYSQLPPYSALSRTRQEPPSSINHLGQELINHDMLTPQKHLDETNRDPYYGSTLQSSIDPYPTLSRERSHRNNDGSDHQSKGRSNQPEPPPRIDRSSKPTHFRGSQDRTFGNQIRTEHSQDSTIGISADYINTANNKSHSLERPNGRLGTFDSSSFSSDSYNKYSTAPNALDNKSRDHYNSTAGHNPRSVHDPYRFTRSTAQPSKPPNPDLRNRMSQVSSKYRMSDGRPVPPPKPSHYQLRPWQSEDDGIEAGFNHVSHTPAGFRSSEALPPPPYSRSSRDCPEFPMHPPYYTPKAHTQVDTMNSLRPPPPPMPDDQRGLHDTFNSRTMGSPSRRGYHDNDSGGFDSGRGSSLDRNYDFRAYTKSINNNTGMSPPRSTTHMNGGGPYHNVPYPPRREPPNPPPYDHHPSPPPPPPSSLLDLSNRENRGSAFELYKKPDSRSPLGIPPSLLAGNPERPNSPSFLSDNNHNVIATARGVFDHTGGTLFSEETGVCIIIPPGALAEGKKQEIFFKVCQEDKIMPPLDQDKGETLLSPLVMCGPHGLQFNIPVELKLPHCASVNPENWSFSLKASDTPNGQPIEWRNVALDKISGEIESCIDDNFVSILVDHF